jgi:chorismate dehydratase
MPNLASFTPRIGWMSFLNTFPMQHGFPFHQGVEGVPEVLNHALSQGELELSLVSAVAYLEHQAEWDLLPTLCISSWGQVNSVLWIRDVQFNPEQHAVQLPSSSASASRLLRYLLAQEAGFESATFAMYPHDSDLSLILSKHHNALVIGDKALRFYEQLLTHSADDVKVLDLATAWHERTKLPFVFGVWCVEKGYHRQHQDAISEWMQALQAHTFTQLQSPDALYEAYLNTPAGEMAPFSKACLQNYWLQSLDYTFTTAHHEALQLMQEAFFNTAFDSP